MVGYIMDTSAWIEVFRGSKEGEQIKEYLFPEPTDIGPPETVPIITPTLVLVEMRSAYVREGMDDQFFEDLQKIRKVSRIYETLEEALSIDAGTNHGNIHNSKNQISYVDCILWSIAESLNMKIISTDKHFKDCPHAIYIKKEGNNEN